MINAAIYLSNLKNIRLWERQLAEQKRLEEQSQKPLAPTVSKSSDLRMYMSV